MRRLVIVSNRVAPPDGVSSGGVGVCILDALRDCDATWFGWNGELVSDEGEIGATCIRQGNVTQVTMPLTERDYREHCLGFCNAALWPVHHYRLDLARFTPECSEAYRRVNSRFADAVASSLHSSDLIWVHDYHFIPLGAYLRARGARNRIGFFLHTPFPPPEVLIAAPEHVWLMRALSEYDVVGFQTKTDQENFCRFVCGFMGGEMVSENTLCVAKRVLTAAIFPAGIDTDSLSAMARSSRATVRIERLHRAGEPAINIIGVDRLDHTKGLPERLRSFRRLLELYPRNRKTTTLMQIAPPTREAGQAHAQIRHELEALCGEINGQFGDVDWTPVRYIHRYVARDALAALYRGSQVGLVTPLRDGMNLVAKEYVAAQDDENPGVLVLSRFAGAAEDLREALIVNPYNTDEVAQAIQRAIAMPREERVERHRALIARVRERDARNWMTGFLGLLDAEEARTINSNFVPTCRRRLSETSPPATAAPWALTEVRPPSGEPVSAGG